MPMNDPEMGVKQGSAKDLKESFTEIVFEFTEQINKLSGRFDPSDNDLSIFQPEVDKCVHKLLDIVSNTIIFDPH